MRKLLFCAAAGLVLAALLPAAGAGAANRGSMVIDPDIGVVTKTFPRFTTARTPGPAVNTTINAGACKTATHCDTIVVEVVVPMSYRDDHFVDVELSYDSSGGNNMGLFQWDNDDPENGTTSKAQFDDSNPKVLTLDGPEGEYYFTVVNWAGSNNGYTLSVRWNVREWPPVDLPDVSRPGFGGSQFEVTRQSTSAQRPRSPDYDFDAFAASEAPRPTPRVVLVPGPDGEMVAVEMPVLARGDRTPAEPGRFDPVVASVVAVLLGAGSLFALFAIRARRRAEETI